MESGANVLTEGYTTTDKYRWICAQCFNDLKGASTRFLRETTPEAVADDIERLLSGNYAAWDVDDYEHLNPRDRDLRELWRRSMQVGGLPEEWVRLDHEHKNELRDIVRHLKQLGAHGKSGPRKFSGPDA